MNEAIKIRHRFRRNRLLCAILPLVAFLSACTDIQRPEPEPFYAETAPPPKQEFRWSNGRPPKSFDPALAASAPETDIVRALFEGLTDLDPRTLNGVPGVAESWTSSPDLRVWTFQLRKNARWSNGQRVTADDFVTSWKRLAGMRDRVANGELIQNIAGFAPNSVTDAKQPNQHSTSPEEKNAVRMVDPSNEAAVAPKQNGLDLDEAIPHAGVDAKVTIKRAPLKFGVEALDDDTLRVTLINPDKDFPKLVAHPIFRPIYGDGAEFKSDPLDTDVVTNGAFTVSAVANDNIVLERSDSYWKRDVVQLERVRFVFKDSAEAALSAYKKGEIDALTNAEFEPLALKILSPYDDFRQATHSALNFYEFNTRNAPFNDRRVREALAISIDRDRITQSELQGTARPALSFLPLSGSHDSDISFDVPKAKQLLESAGFPSGTAFPKIRLLVNRNDTQQRVARAVARMWKQNLNLDSDIIVKNFAEIDAAWEMNEYDLIRRGVVLPTADALVGMAAIFRKPVNLLDEGSPSPTPTLKAHSEDVEHAPTGLSSELNLGTGEMITEDQANLQMQAIPLYFPTAYSLVKPYVRGFEVNGLDAPALRDVSIDSSWQPKRQGAE